jgi:hypothetical protein
MPNLIVRTFLGGFLLVLMAVAAQAQTAAGKVVGSAGDCFVERGSQHVAIKLGSSVDVGDVVNVPADGKIKLRMSDGSILSIAAGSKMTISGYTVDAQGKRQDVALSLGAGLLRAVVSPVERPTTFEVKTATGTAAVRSTDWFIEVNAAGTGVAVRQGSVNLRSDTTGVIVLIPQGFSSSLANGQNPTPPERMSAAAFAALIARVEILLTRLHAGPPGGGEYYPEEPYYPPGGAYPGGFQPPPGRPQGPPGPPRTYTQPTAGGYNPPPSGGDYPHAPDPGFFQSPGAFPEPFQGRFNNFNSYGSFNR